MVSFSPAVSTGAPEGHQDGFACHSLFSATCCKFIIVASQLPQQQLGGLFKPKWYLRAVRRHIEITHTLPVSLSLALIHTQRGGEKLHQKVIMEIRKKLSTVPNKKWCLWWSVRLFQKQRNGYQLFTQSLLALIKLHSGGHHCGSAG